MDKNKVIAEKLFPERCWHYFDFTADKWICRNCDAKDALVNPNFYHKHSDMQKALDRVGELGLQDEYVSKLRIVAVSIFGLINATLEQKADALFKLVKEME